MKFLFTALVAFGMLTPNFVEANEEQNLLGHSCRAKEVRQYYCPVTQDWWNGPYYDEGCSVSCEESQRATCSEASCDDGDPVASSCSCN